MRRPLTGVWYRVIRQKHFLASLNAAHTPLVGSRLSDGKPGRPTFEVLYLAESPLVAMFESRAWYGDPFQPATYLATPRSVYTTIFVSVVLQTVVDLTEVGSYSALATTAQEMTGDWRGYRERSERTSLRFPAGTAPTQELGQALFDAGDVEGFIAMSSRVPTQSILVIFPERMRRGSVLVFDDPDTVAKASIEGT